MPVTDLLATITKAGGIALLMGALLTAYAWAHFQEPRRTWLLRQAKWLVIPGYVVSAMWALLTAYGVFALGCDPVFGGWTRTPLWVGFPSSELLACSEQPIQARVKLELASKHPNLPAHWSHVYLHYNEAAWLDPNPERVWLFSMERNELRHVRTARLEFRPVPERRGGLLWWQPQEASEEW
jgi:hypothetical protein